MAIRIGLIHALPGSIEPVESAFEKIWPESEVVSLYDRSLYADYESGGGVTVRIARRVTSLIQHSADSGSRGILFTGSLFSEPVEAARSNMTIPVLTAYEAMIEEGFSGGRRLGLLATVEDTIASMERDVRRFARRRRIEYSLDSRLVKGAMDALLSGDRDRHNAMVADAAAELGDCETVMLAQHSMASAQRLIRDLSGRRILNSPETAAAKLRKLVTA
jgi:Asp/Glu/hydantoin racemase